MKKIYSFFRGITLTLCVSLSTGAFSQPICGAILENFDNTGGTTAGFFGDMSLGTTGSDGYLNKPRVIASAIYGIATPTYVLANNATSVGFGFEIGGSERIARVEVAIVYVSTLNNEITTFFIDQFVPSYNQATGTATICRAISLTDLPGFPVGGRYRFRFELTPNSGNGQSSQNIWFDDFRTTAIGISQSSLPVVFIGLEARKMSTGVQLTWKVAGEEDVNRYEVERSTDGKNFASIANISNTKKDTYTYLDANNNSVVYYRIKNVDNNGAYKYSSIARIANGKSGIVIRAFPQPVTNQLIVQHPVIRANSVLTVSTADGRVVKSVKPSNGTMQTYVDMALLQKGMYFIRFDAGDGNVETMKVLKQ